MFKMLYKYGPMTFKKPFELSLAPPSGLFFYGHFFSMVIFSQLQAFSFIRFKNTDWTNA